MKIVFLGTPSFACPSLKALAESGFNVIAAFSQPDRQRGRGHKVMPTPVKECALNLGISVYQFEKIKSPEGVDALKALKPDVMVTAAFGQLLSAENLAVPKLGTVNVHASLLPKYRGAAPIEWCLINGERETGITTMYTDIGMDTGDMILSRAISIGEDETCASLRQRLAELGAITLVDTLRLIESGKAPRTAQNEAEASYYPMLKKEDARIDFNAGASEIKNLVRAMNGSLGAYTEYGGGRVKVFRAERADGFCGEPGMVVRAGEGGLIVGCSGGVVRLCELQFPGGRRMADTELLRGKRISEGERFGA